jgi:hypothetical protein
MRRMKPSQLLNKRGGDMSMAFHTSPIVNKAYIALIGPVNDKEKVGLSS